MKNFKNWNNNEEITKIKKFNSSNGNLFKNWAVLPHFICIIDYLTIDDESIKIDIVNN